MEFQVLWQMSKDNGIDHRHLDGSYSGGFSNRQFLVVMIVAIAIIVADTSILRISGFLGSRSYQSAAIGTFVLVSVILLAFQFLILGHVRSKMKQMETTETALLSAIRFGAIIGQYGIFAILAVLILQIVMGSYFSTFLLTATIAISYSLSIVAVSLLALRFLHWYKTNRNSLALLYGISSIALAVNAVFTLAFAVVILNDKNPEVLPHPGMSILNLVQGSLKDALNSAYIISSIASFVMMWVSTTLLLRYYSQSFGSTRYWTVLSVPLAYFLAQFLVLFIDVLDPLIEVGPTTASFILTIIFAVSKPAGGILFGVAFLIVSRKVASSSVQNYLTIAGYGLVLFFSSNQAVVLVSNTPYPPFGLGSVSYAGLSSYLILIGIYFSAISISQDRKILANLRRSAMNELKLLESMGSSESKEKIISEVTKIARKNQTDLVQASGVQSSLDEEGMKKYLEDVLNEIRSKRGDKPKDDPA